jgi:hypothetical protein
MRELGATFQEKKMRLLVVFALVLLLIPAVAYAGHSSCGCHKASCGDSCKGACGDGCGAKVVSDCGNKCGSCKDKCHSGCKSKCDGGCKDKCQSGCNKCAKPACGSCGKPSCDGGCKSKSACGSCGKSSCGGGCQSGGGCAQPCACEAWHDFCGCGTVSSLCITITTACDGTAGPLKLQLRDPYFKTLALIEIPGPIEGYYNFTYTFDTPVEASMLGEAVLINDTEDPATLTSLRVVGMDGYCFNWVYVDHTCPGAIVGPGGCKRMVIY